MLMSETVAQEVFCKKGVLKNSAEFKGKHLSQSLFLNKVKVGSVGAQSACFCYFFIFAKFLQAVAPM